MYKIQSCQKYKVLEDLCFVTPKELFEAETCICRENVITFVCIKPLQVGFLKHLETVGLCKAHEGFIKSQGLCKVP